MSFNHILGYLIAVCILINEVNCLQRFAEQPKYTEVNPGEDTLLTCKIIDKAGTCSWQKDNKPVGIYAKKYEWAGSIPQIHLQPPTYNGGDCSLWIRSATLEFDDGLWECQVTASDFTAQDALTSQPVRLVVRINPQRPRLEHEGVHVPPGHNITVDTGAVATVKCISHYGNPPALIKWFLGEQEITPLGPQINSTEPDNRRTWSATSVVQVPASRERHGDMLKCVTLHESYAAKSMSVEAKMDIKYAPTIRLVGAPEIDLEEGKDTLIMKCIADANPSASIVWRRAGRSEIASLQESLQLRPVGRRDAGLYTCQAQNSVGTSEQLSIELDVKYAPRILSAGPDRLTTAPLFSPAAFECIAEGNPLPTYKWVQRIAQGTKYLERGSQSRLVIDNVTYDFQGEYECRATNFINGQERSVTSEPVSLQVVGAPQVLRLHPSMHTVSVKRGDSASLSLVVCADPRPHHVAWEWGSLRLEAGASVDRFRAEEVIQDAREDCYLSTLHIMNADEHDARPYYLVVENERGTDRHAVHLSVEEPLELSYLLGIAGGCLAALLILICLCCYAIRGKKCCFKSSSGYKSSDKDSEKADLKSRSDSTSGPQGDSIYTTPAGFHHQHHHHHQHSGSPEAMKSTTTLVHDNDLIWQHQQPQHYDNFHLKHHPEHHPLRSSISTGTLYKTTKSTTTTTAVPVNEQIGNNTITSVGDLLLGTQRHQRDLFTGDLGIPEIKTRVGSVVHTFETMAMLRHQNNNNNNKEKSYNDDQNDIIIDYIDEYPNDYYNNNYSKYMTTTTTKIIDNNNHKHHQHIKNSIFKSPIKINFNKSKYNQLKKKSLENRKKFANTSKPLKPLKMNSLSISSLPKIPNINTQQQKHNIKLNRTEPIIEPKIQQKHFLKHEQKKQKCSNISNEWGSSGNNNDTISTTTINLHQQNHQQPQQHQNYLRKNDRISPTSIITSQTNFENCNTLDFDEIIDDKKISKKNHHQEEKSQIKRKSLKSLPAPNPPLPPPPPEKPKQHQLISSNDNRYSDEIGNEVVNSAFKEIFNSYGNGSDYDDDDDDNEYEKNQNELINNDTIPMTHKTYIPTNEIISNKNKFNKPKRSTTLSDFFERAKNLNSTTNKIGNIKKSKLLKKLPSSSLLSNDMTKLDMNQIKNYDDNNHLLQQTEQHHLKKYHCEQNISNHQEHNSVDINNSKNHDEFLRGSTVSQSFIKNMKQQPTIRMMKLKSTFPSVTKSQINDNVVNDDNNKSIQYQQKQNHWNEENSLILSPSPSSDDDHKNSLYEGTKYHHGLPIINQLQQYEQHKEYYNPLYISATTGNRRNIMMMMNQNQQRSKSSSELLTMVEQHNDNYDDRNNRLYQGGGDDLDELNDSNGFRYNPNGFKPNRLRYSTRKNYTNSFKPRTIDKAVI